MTFDTKHSDMIHDAQFDYYAKLLATCSSDCTIRLYDVSKEEQELLQVITGHESPVWQIDFAHPKFGQILASCDYSGKVFLWKLEDKSSSIIKEHIAHSSSVNCVKWAPHELGPILACASSDGNVSVLEYKNDDSNWASTLFEAHAIGCTSLSWSPSIVSGALVTSYGAADEATTVKRLVTGGCDNLVKIWRFDHPNKWTEEIVLEGHSDWVRDVAWAPNIGMPKNMIASCSQDKTVIIWSHNEKTNTWVKKVIEFPDALWKIEWTLTGDALAISCADNTISVWKENDDNNWEKIKEFKEGSQ